MGSSRDEEERDGHSHGHVTVAARSLTSSICMLYFSPRMLCSADTSQRRWGNGMTLAPRSNVSEFDSPCPCRAA